MIASACKSSKVKCNVIKVTRFAKKCRSHCFYLLPGKAARFYKILPAISYCLSDVPDDTLNLSLCVSRKA